MKPPLSWRGWLLLVGGLLASAGAWAQGPAPVWQGALPVAGRTVAVPGSRDDLYVAGVFRGRQRFGPFVLASPGEAAIFVARWNSRTRQYLWAKQAACATGDWVTSLAAVGRSVYVAGSFSGSLQWGAVKLKAEALNALFVAKLTDEGATHRFEWAHASQGDAFVELHDLVASGDNIYVAGSYRGSFRLGEVRLASLNSEDGFVARLTDEGAASHWTWAVRAGGAGDDELNALAVVGTRVYVAGAVTDQAACGNIQLGREGTGTDLLLARLDDVGPATTFTWAERLRHAAHSRATDLLASADTLYLAGDCGYAPGLGLTEQVHNPIQTAVLLKLRDTGATVRAVWAKTIADNQSAYWSILGRRGANLYVIGSFRDVLYLDLHKVAAPPHIDALFMANIRDQGDYGNCVWLRQFSATPRPLYWAGGAITGGGLLYLSLGVEDIILHDRRGRHLKLGPLPLPHGLLLPTGQPPLPRKP